MRVLFDTNVVLDVLLNRDPWVTQSRAVWQANDEGHIVGYIAACVVGDIFYIARRLATLETAHAAVGIFLDAFEVCVATDRFWNKQMHCRAPTLKATCRLPVPI